MRRLWKAAFLILFCSLVNVSAQPVVGSVVNGASYSPAVSRGCLISIFGTSLAPSTVAASSVPLPTSLGVTSVRIGGIAAPLYFVSALQINAQVPFEVQGTTAAVVVTTNGVNSAPLTVTIGQVSPGLFSAAATGSGRGLYFDANFGTFTTALTPGSTIILYATGLGQTNPPAATGAGGAPGEPLNRVTSLPDVFIGETKAQVAYAGLAPGFVGVYQLNVTVPSGVASTRMVLVQSGLRSNVTDVIITSGTNVRNVSGTLQALYPASTTTSSVSFSPLLVAVGFTAKFDLLPAAQRFTVVAVSDAGSCVITIDPQAGTYSATVNVPSSTTRSFDFGGSDLTPVDLQTGTGFPLNIIPQSRIDAAARTALNSLPLPNVSTPGAANGVFQTTGVATAGSTFTVDSQNNSTVSSFAAWLPVIYAPYAKSRTTTVKLFVDGVLVTSLNIPFNTV